MCRTRRRTGRDPTSSSQRKKGRGGKRGTLFFFFNVSNIGAVQKVDVINQEIYVYPRDWTSVALTPPLRRDMGFIGLKPQPASLRPHALPSHAFADYEHINGREGVFCLSLGSQNPEAGLNVLASL